MHGCVATLLLIHGLIVSRACPTVNKVSGFVNYQGYGKQDYCSVTLPEGSGDEYALVLKLTTISMKNTERRCGYVYLPGDVSFCSKPLQTCFIYGLTSQCDFAEISRIANATRCEDTMVYFSASMTRTISTRSKYDGSRSFRMEYKYEKCSRLVENEIQTTTEEVTTIRADPTTELTTVPDTSSSYSFLENNVDRASKNESTVPTITFVGVVIAFAILLLLSLTTILWMHRRNTTQNSKHDLTHRVQLSLATPGEGGTSRTAWVHGEDNQQTDGQVIPLHGEDNNQAALYSEIGDHFQAPSPHPGETLRSTYANTVDAPSTSQPDCVYAVVRTSIRKA